MHPQDSELIQYAVSDYKTGQQYGVEQLERVDNHQTQCKSCRTKIADYKYIIEQFVVSSEQASTSNWLSLLQRLNLELSLNQGTENVNPYLAS